MLIILRLVVAIGGVQQYIVPYRNLGSIASRD
jgi:hypothetical protein